MAILVLDAATAKTFQHLRQLSIQPGPGASCWNQFPAASKVLDLNFMRRSVRVPNGPQTPKSVYGGKAAVYNVVQRGELSICHHCVVHRVVPESAHVVPPQLIRRFCIHMGNLNVASLVDELR